MGEFEILILTLAILIFSVFASMALTSQVNSRLDLIQNEIQLSAFSEAEAIINQAWSKHFDEYTLNNPEVTIDDSSDFTAQSSFGDGSTVIRNFDKLDDFGNGSDIKIYPEKTVSFDDPEGSKATFYKYKPKTKLEYINGSPPTTHKKLTVYLEITSPEDFPGERTIGSTSEEYHIKLSRTFSYYLGYHGLE